MAVTALASDLAGSDPPGFRGADQAAVLEHPQVLDHRGERDSKWFGERAHRERSLAEALFAADRRQESADVLRLR